MKKNNIRIFFSHTAVMSNRHRFKLKYSSQTLFSQFSFVSMNFSVTVKNIQPCLLFRGMQNDIPSYVGPYPHSMAHWGEGL